MVCANVISYEIVLASGTVTTASETTNPDLWRALKGGSNNFGIVTRFTTRAFPCLGIWSGMIFLPGLQYAKVLDSFHQGVSQLNPKHPKFDRYATGPMATFSYVHQLGLQVISINLVYTNYQQGGGSKWPAYWKATPFASLWRVWSTCRMRTVTSANDEMQVFTPPGRRQSLSTVTVRNDPRTIRAVYDAYIDATAEVRKVSVKGLLLTLVMQALVPEWASKGKPSIMGLEGESTEPLVVVSFPVNWDEEKDDKLVHSMTRRAIEKIEAISTANGTAHRYRFTNYCNDWQKPLQGYGEENFRFMQRVSREYDPDGLFQKGCIGGFKLDMDGKDHLAA